MIGMPLKLTVSFLLIGLMLPMIAGMVSMVEEQSSDSAADYECAAVEDCIYRVFRSGSGSTETIHVDLGPKDWISLGGTGSDAYSIRLYCNGNLKKTVYLDRAPVQLSDEITDIAGSTDVTFACTSVNHKLIVGVAG